MENIAALNTEYNENRNRIFHCIRAKGMISRPSIARELELSLPTVTMYLQELEEKGLIHKNGSMGNTGGRRAAGYSVVGDKVVAVGLDLTQTYIMATSVDLNGNAIISEKMECEFSNKTIYWNKAAEFVNDIIERSSREYTLVPGIGIATQSIVSKDHKRVLYVKTMDIKDLTSATLRLLLP